MNKQIRLAKVYIGVIWFFFIILVGFFCYNVGKNSQTSSFSASQAVLSPTPAKTVAQSENPGKNEYVPTPHVDLNGICQKAGVAQKSEYLVPYTIQNGDTISKIAETQLKDSSRVNELTKLNEDAVGLSAGSTLYLPPENIKKSSGNLALVSGMIIKKDNAVWQLSYGGGEKGLGLAIPGYYFNEVSNKDNFQAGDCVTVLLDNGVKVYTITKQ